MMFREMSFIWPGVLLFLCATAHAASQMSLAKVSFKLNYVREEEKLSRAWATANEESVSDIALPNGFAVSDGDTITAQTAFTDANGAAVFPHQLFLRFVNQRTRQDNLFLLTRKGREARVEVALRKEVRGDAEFWVHGDVYAVEVVMGDALLVPSATWTVTKSMRFAEEAEPMFRRAPAGVFDFDVSVKKELLPEFVSPVPEPEKRATLPAILVALVGVLVPLPGLLVAWTKLGVFPLELPQGGKKIVALGFQACMIGHMMALAMFWAKWNIITTWKVMGVLMVPTLLLGRSVVSTENEKP